MNELKDIQNFLSTCAPFDALPESVLNRLCRSVEISYERKGTVVLPISAENVDLHVIRRGAVSLTDDSGRLVEKRGERGLYGYPSMLTGKPTRLLGRAAEDCLIYHIPQVQFDTLRRDHRDFDRFFSAALSERVSDACRTDGAAQGLMAESVRSLMSAPPITVSAQNSVQETAAVMAHAGTSSVVVTGETLADVQGVFTDRDLRTRVVATRLDLNTPIARVMTADPLTIDAGQSALEALLSMNEAAIHHLPVVSDGQLVGVITLTDLYCALNNHPIYLAASIKRQPTPEAVARTSQKRFDLLAQLIGMGMNARAIGQMMTAITDAATRRLVELAEQELGPPPMAYAWLSFGSQARREQTGRTDQDNGLIVEHEPDEDQAAYFAALSSLVCDQLNACGFVHCPGGIMASNKKWRLSLDGWRRQFASWIDQPEPKPLMYVSIFFDLRSVCGEQRLVDELAAFVFERTGGNTIFLRFMAANALQHRPPLGFFRQFVVEHGGDHGKEGLNLKLRGVVPVIGLARMRALEKGIAHPETDQRLAQTMDAQDQDLASLNDALDVIGQVRLRHQLSQHERGETLSNWVNPKDLSPLARRNLKAAFTIVADAQNAMARRYRLE